MSRRFTAWLAWSLAGISVAMFVGSVALFVLVRVAESSGDRISVDYVSKLLVYVPFLAFPIVGALVASRRPGNAIGWICLVSGLFWMQFALGDASNAYERATTGKIASSVKLDALTQGLWVPPVGLLGIYMILLFPDGKTSVEEVASVRVVRGGGDGTDTRSCSSSFQGVWRGIGSAQSFRAGSNTHGCPSWPRSSYCCFPCVS